MATKSVTKNEPAGELARPSFVPQSKTGTEHITKDDMKIPRIVIAQALSPQLKKADPTYVAELEEGDMFNTLTGEIYGKGPILVHIVRADPPRGIEFYPRNSGGGIKDFDVPVDDPRMQFTTDEEGKRHKPVATKFYDYFVVRVPFVSNNPMECVVALSMKGAAIKVARDWNGLIKMRGTDLWAGRYSVSSVFTKGKEGDFYNFRVVNAGWVDDEKQFNALKAFYEAFREKKVVVEREPGQDDEELAGDM